MGANLEYADFRERIEQRGLTDNELGKLLLTGSFMDNAKLGYFRDIYNTYGLFNFLRCNLAGEWEWAKLYNRGEWFDEPDIMSLQGVESFLAQITEAHEELDEKSEYILREDTVGFARVMHDAAATDPELVFTEGGNRNLPQGVKYMTLTRREASQFFERLAALIYFLKEAVSQKIRIMWNV